MPLPKRTGLWMAMAALVLSALGGLFVLQRQRPYDSSFDTRVGDPAYRSGGPVVLYDEGHQNTHSASGAYKPFTDLIGHDGFKLRVLHGPVTPETLQGVAIFLVVLPRGDNDANDQSAFTGEEIATVERWVREGGSLLLVTDHWPYGAAAAALARPFEVQMGMGMVEDPQHSDPSRGDSHLVFSSENGLLRDQPILRGRSEAERIHRVLTFTGQSLLGPPAAVPFLALGDTAVELPPTPPTVERKGGDVKVHMTYGAPVSAKGRAQAVALEAGKGRVVVLGEAGLLRAQLERGGVRVGMNAPGYDNRQLALNLMRWLSRIL